MKTRPVSTRLATMSIALIILAGFGNAPALAEPTANETPQATESPAASAGPVVPSGSGSAATIAPDQTPSAQQSTAAAPGSQPSPLSGLAGTGLERPTDGGAVMGQAGKQIPTLAGPLAAPLSRAGEPSVGEQPPGTDGKPLGLDVSGWQQNVNWTAVKNSGARFAYVKTSEGPWTLNDYFSQQYNGAANVGLLRGGYHFARPNLSSGASQAKVMLASGGGWTADGKTLPPALDIEDNPYVSSDGTNKCYGMTPSQLVAWSKDFTNTIKASTGKDAVVYTSYYFWQECFGSSNAFAGTNPLWIAAYYASSPWMPGQWPQYTFWQYANNFANAEQTIPATFPGDQNVFNGSMDQLRELAGGVQKAWIGAVPGATLISGKWAGDGKAYVGWVKDAYWCLEMPERTRRCFDFGVRGDKPVVGDWDGDGTDTIGIVRNGTWQLSNSLVKLSVSLVQYFGVGTDTPVTGDWDGDGKTTIGLVRNGSWQLSNSQSTWAPVNIYTNFGIGTDTPVVGDWNGDNKDSVGVWRAGTYWLSDSASSPPVNYVFGFGIPTDAPAIGDWNGDGKTTVGIFRNGNWHLTNDLKALKVDSARF
ncbi:GH25 family lysozyme [Arthrobacter sp. HLT1-20]